MFLAVVFGLLQLLMVMTLTPGAAGEPAGTKSSNVEETAADAEGGDARRAGMDLRGRQSELVSRRRLYDGDNMMSAWNDDDMAWLKKRAGAEDVDRRGWGNGIPPWMRGRRIVVPVSSEADRRSAPRSKSN